MDFLGLFKDPIFVAISKTGGHVLHTHDLQKVLDKNTLESKEGAYFTVNGFANFEEGSSRGRTKANVTTFNCNFLDIDLTPEKRRTQAELVYKALSDTNLKPTAVVLTGKGLHVYWLYKSPVKFTEIALKQYEILQNAIVEHFKSEGADRQARDAARVLRVPGAKYFDSQGVHTADVELLYFNPDTLYDPIEIARYFRNSIPIDTKEGEALVKRESDFNLLTAYNVKLGGRHHMAYSVALSLIQKAKSLSAARELFHAAISTWASPPSDPLDLADCWKQFDNAVKMLETDKPQMFIGDPDSSPIAITSFENVEEKPLEWLWEGFIAKGKAHMLTGNPGLGKSQITVDIAARLSTGTAFPSYTLGAKALPPMGVIILSAEDGAGDTIRPRLRAAGADLTRVFHMSSSKIVKTKDGKMSMSSLALKEDAEHILKAIATLPVKIGLVIIDPISAFLAGDQDSNSNSDVRSTLNQLQSVIMDAGIAMLMINHVNKNVNAKGAHMRSMGSVGWNAVARATFYVAEDEKEGRIAFLLGKANLAKRQGAGFFYKINEKTLNVAGQDQGVPFIDWDTTEFPTKDADDYMNAAPNKKKTKVEECKDQLSMYMVDKDITTAAEAVAYLKEHGFSKVEAYSAARTLGMIGSEHGIWKRN